MEEDIFPQSGHYWYQVTLQTSCELERGERRAGQARPEVTSNHRLSFYQSKRPLIASFLIQFRFMFSCFPNKPGNNIFSPDHWVLYTREQRIQATISMMDWLSSRTSGPNIDFILQWTRRLINTFCWPAIHLLYLACTDHQCCLPSWHGTLSVQRNFS